MEKEKNTRKFVFEGNYLNGERNGKGREYEDGELIFKGFYLNGKRNGKGKEYKNSSLIYEGNYSNGHKNGKFKHYDFYNDKFQDEEYTLDIKNEELDINIT